MSVASSCETATTKSALSYFNFVNVGRDSPASLPPPVLTEELLARRPSRIRCLCPLSSEANFAGKCMWLPPLRNTAGFLLPISAPRNLIFWTRSIARLGMGIGRASGRDRVGPCGGISVEAVSYKKNEEIEGDKTR